LIRLRRGGPAGKLRRVEDDNALIAELTQAALTTAAPDELAVFDETAQEYFADPQAALTAAKGDAAVGFGLELAMLTPAALAIGSAVLQAVLGLLADKAVMHGSGAVVVMLRKVLRRQAPAAELGITAAQAHNLRLVALQRAHALGLPEAQARQLAESFVGALTPGQ
jgi:hypothetical protein